MKILSTNNCQPKQNFGMLRITGTKTAEELEEGIAIVRKLTPGNKPFKIKDAISPDYKPDRTQGGGWSLFDFVAESKIPEYEANGDVLIFDEELRAKIWTGSNIAENFDQRFRQITEISIEKLRQLHAHFKTNKENVALLEGALEKAKTGVRAALINAAKAFGER